MNALELLQHASTQSVSLSIEGETLWVDDPDERATPELLAQLAEHKHALIALLTSPDREGQTSEQEEPPALPAPAPVERPVNPNAPNVRSDGTRCLTQIYLSEKHPRHVGFPTWIDPKDNHFLGWDVRNSYLRGHVDVMENWWCGMCFFRCQLINRGAVLGYPELPPSYRIEGYPSAGYEAWLALAQYGGSVRVETAVRWVFVSLSE